MRRAAALLMSLALATSALADAPAQSPRPPVRPEAPAALPQPVPVSDPALAGIRPLPKPDMTQLAQAAPVAPAKKKTVAPTAAAQGQLCGVNGLAGRRIAPITSRVQGCGLPDGVEITAVSGIPMSQPLTIDCTTAVAFKRWLDRGILPAIGNRGGGVRQVTIFDTYSCRPRNNVRGAKVSEHGRGHAVDFAGVTLMNGQTITVLDGWKTQPKLLKTIHASACGTFGTVLGPQADRYHQNHIHVDTARYRSGAYCR